MSAVPSGMPVVPTTSPPFFLISRDIGVARRLAPGIVGEGDVPLLAHLGERGREGDRLRRRVVVQAEGVAVAGAGGQRGVEAHGDHVDDLGLLPHRHAGQTDVGQEAADVDVDVVLVHHLLRLAAPDVGLGFIVDDDEFDRPAVDAAVLVDAVGRHLQSDHRGLAAGGAGARERLLGADLVTPLRRRRPRATAPAPASSRRSRRRPSRRHGGASPCRCTRSPAPRPRLSTFQSLHVLPLEFDCSN